METFNSDDLETKDLIQNSAAGDLTADASPMATVDNGETAAEKPLLAVAENCASGGGDVETGRNGACRSAGVWRMVSYKLSFSSEATL